MLLCGTGGSELASGSHGHWFESRKTQQFFSNGYSASHYDITIFLYKFAILYKTFSTLSSDLISRCKQTSVNIHVVCLIIQYLGYSLKR